MKTRGVAGRRSRMFMYCSGSRLMLPTTFGQPCQLKGASGDDGCEMTAGERMAETRAELDKLGCGMPGCLHDHSVLYLQTRCHSQGVRVTYNLDAGDLKLECAECGHLVSEIRVLPFTIQLNCRKRCPSVGLEIAYSKRTGRLEVACIQCKTFLGEIEVAPGFPTGWIA
jgi:hypothetical protein